MATQKITNLTALTGADASTSDELVIVDVSDTTMASSGTNKRINLRELDNWLATQRKSYVTFNGSFFQNTTTFAYWTVASSSTTEGSTLGYLTLMPLGFDCRLVDVSVWVQSGSAANERITAYDMSVAPPNHAKGTEEASLSAGAVTTYTFNTSTYDFTAGAEFALSWTPSTIRNGVSFAIRFQLL